MQTEELRKSRNIPPFPQAQKGKPKEDSDREGGEPTDNCAGCSDEERLSIEDGMPKRTIGEQLQKIQDKADVISKLQRELQKDIQAFKLSRLLDRSTDSDRVNNWTGNGVFKLQRELQQGIQAGKLSSLQDGDTNGDMANIWTENRAPSTTSTASAHGAHEKWPSSAPSHNRSDMVNIRTERWAPQTSAAPDRVVQDHNRGTKQQVGDALLWKRVPPEPNEPHTKVTKQGKWMNWCPHLINYGPCTNPTSAKFDQS